VVQPIQNLGLSNTIRAGQRGWAKTLSNEVALDGVTVNTLLPGRIQTTRVDQINAAAAERQGKTVDEIARASRAEIPMGRYGTVEEFADVAVFMLSDRAGYMTGAITCVDGGAIRSV
jgi:3-oxoacyl-[acyl-carrier protein] reductase